MNRRFIHIIVLVLLFSSCRRGTNWGVSMDKNSTEPFGLYLAYHQLDAIFPSAKKTTIYKLSDEIRKQNRKAFFSEKNNLLVAITAALYIDREEVEAMYSYVEHGGNVLLLSMNLPEAFDTVFNFVARNDDVPSTPTEKDSLTMIRNLWDKEWHSFELDHPFPKSYLVHKSGQAITQKLVQDKFKTVLLEKSIGEGKIMIGLCPELLTNYALLKDSNIHFYEQLFSRFKERTTKIKWFSKYAVYPDRENQSSNLWNLLKKRSYRYAFLVLLFMAILFFIFETKRRQRVVDVIPPVTNDSLAFTETIGKLYYGEKDNANLAQKMIQYYLEHIRTVYNVPSAHLNSDFVAKLAQKLNRPLEEMQRFVGYLNDQLTATSISEDQIKELYRQLKKYS